MLSDVTPSLSKGLVMWILVPYPGPMRGFGPVDGPQDSCSTPPNPLLAWWYTTCATSVILRKHRSPDQGPPSTLAHKVGGPVTSLAGILHCKSPWISSLVVLNSHHPDGGNFCLSIYPRDQPLVAPMNGCSGSFFPNASVCMNILWRMQGHLVPSAFHQGYFSKMSLEPSWHSASCTRIPSSWAIFLVVAALCHLLL